MRHSVGVMYVGVDLAWGERRPTGVAVLDSGGALLALASATTDDEIAAQVAPYVEGDCLVAIDAPLIVTNPSRQPTLRGRAEPGLRPLRGGRSSRQHREAGVRRRLARGAAGRAARARHGPGRRSGRRAIEVYPHPATVALFSLRRTLKYKARPGRTLGRAPRGAAHPHPTPGGAAGRSTPPWTSRCRRLARPGRRIETAGTKAALRRAEDQVDAVVCAYVALFSDRRPEATTTYGDAVTGYIVTPTLPAELEPERRRRRSSVRHRGLAVRRLAAAGAARHGALRARGHRPARRGRHQLPRGHRRAPRA